MIEYESWSRLCWEQNIRRQAAINPIGMQMLNNEVTHIAVQLSMKEKCHEQAQEYRGEIPTGSLATGIPELIKVYE
jgi:hypothetical protein